MVDHPEDIKINDWINRSINQSIDCPNIYLFIIIYHHYPKNKNPESRIHSSFIHFWFKQTSNVQNEFVILCFSFRFISLQFTSFSPLPTVKSNIIKNIYNFINKIDKIIIFIDKNKQKFCFSFLAIHLFKMMIEK